jgi:Biopolymer transport protein ExbD/TolR
MRRYKKKPRTHGEVELNMAAMLDMAFQLLAFFILTFRPSAVESQVSLRMPPAKATSDGSAGQLQLDPPKEEDFGGLLEMKVYSTADGEISRIQIGGQSLSGPLDQVLGQLGAVLPTKIVANIEGINLQASNDLLYERLMQVVDVCTRQKLPNGEPLTKISIGQMAGGP